MSNTTLTKSSQNTRHWVDTVGFAHRSVQMDTLMARINLQFGEFIDDKLKHYQNTSWKTVISPHDDYIYVGPLYPIALKNIKTPIVIIFGVAHKASKLNLEDQIIFDSFESWEAPYGRLQIPKLREGIIQNLPEGMYQVNNEMQQIEHSVEAIVPFLQYYNRDIQIISILVPYMSLRKMKELSEPLAEAIFKTTNSKGLVWGKDFSIVISNDAVHYGDEGWGDKNFAFVGSGKEANLKALEHEKEIIDQCLTGAISDERIEKFTRYTVNEENHKEYKWTWCGRYSVPFGLLTSVYLQKKLHPDMPLEGQELGYMTSIDHDHILVDDIGLGTTAPANERHWVGYSAIGYR